LATFDEKCAITRKRYNLQDRRIVSSKVKYKVKSYVLYQMAMFLMTLGDPLLPKTPYFLYFCRLSCHRSE